MSASGSGPVPVFTTAEQFFAHYRSEYGEDHPRPEEIRAMFAARWQGPVIPDPVWVPPAPKDPAVQFLLDQFGISDPRDSPPVLVEDEDAAWDELADEVDSIDTAAEVEVWDEGQERIRDLVEREAPYEVRLKLDRRAVPGAWLKGLKAAGINATLLRGKPLVVQFPCPFDHVAEGGDDWAEIQLQIDPGTYWVRVPHGGCSTCSWSKIEDWLHSCPVCADSRPHATHLNPDPEDPMEPNPAWLTMGDRSPFSHVAFALAMLALPRTSTALLSELPDDLVKIFRPERAVKPKSGGKPVVPKPMPPGVEIMEDGPDWTPETISAWLVAHGVEAKTGANQAWKKIKDETVHPPWKLVKPVQVERRAEWLRAGGAG